MENRKFDVNKLLVNMRENGLMSPPGAGVKTLQTSAPPAVVTKLRAVEPQQPVEEPEEAPVEEISLALVEQIQTEAARAKLATLDAIEVKVNRIVKVVQVELTHLTQLQEEIAAMRAEALSYIPATSEEGSET